MENLSAFLITGATSGLGLETAIFLANTDKANMIIVGARKPSTADALCKAIAKDQLIVLELDTSCKESVKRFATEVQEVLGSNVLAGVALNAGIQIISGDQYSIDGDELTFATNVLGHIALNQYLQPVFSPSTIIVSTASGTRYIAFDPGLMPGTELARDQPAALRFAWKNILPTAAKMIDGASTAKRSGAMLAQILMGQKFPEGSGLHTEFTGKAIPSSRLSYDQATQDALMAWAEHRVL